MEASRREYCRCIIAKQLRDRQWGLVMELDDFVDHVCARLDSAVPDPLPQAQNTVELATALEYGIVFFEACTGPDPTRRNQAFTELHRRYYAIAYAKTQHRELARDLAQEAIVKTLENLGNIHNQAGFLTYTRQIIANLTNDRIDRLQTEFRHTIPHERDRSDPDASTSGDKDAVPVRLRGPLDTDGPVVKKVIEQEVREKLQAVIQACVKSPSQQAVLIGLYIYQDSYDEIAQAMHITNNYAHQLRHRGFALLERCARFLAFLREGWLGEGSNA